MMMKRWMKTASVAEAERNGMESRGIANRPSLYSSQRSGIKHPMKRLM